MPELAAQIAQTFPQQVPMPERPFRQSISENRRIANHGRNWQRTKWRRPTVESPFSFRIDVDALRRDGLIRLGIRGGCVIRFSGPYHDLEVECETHIGSPWDDWG
jgi:hypothetical protein